MQKEVTDRILHSIPQRARKIAINIKPVERLLSTGAAVGILFQSRNSGWVRKAASVALAGELFRRGFSGKSRLYRWLTSESVSRIAMRSERTLTIHRPRPEIFAAWRDASNAPLFMKGVNWVEPLGSSRSHWYLETAGGFRFEWDHEIIDVIENQMIVWKVSGPLGIQMEGRIFFADAPADWGTEVKLILESTEVDPDAWGKDNLRRFKQWMETGEIAFAEAEVSARAAA